MATNSASKLDAIRARVARRVGETPPEEPPITPSPQPAAPDLPDNALVAASAHFLGDLETMVQGRPIKRIPIAQIAPDTRPEMRQPRLLPTPDELFGANQTLPAYGALLDELRALGESLRQGQIQPIVVYSGTSDQYPAARYLIFVGHRRWTAAVLVGLATLDAVEVEPPPRAERLRVQYAENEAREEFSDVERAWTLMQMKQAMGDVPWETLEAAVQISRTRRHELIRMLAFSEAQQRQIALLRLQETQARPLHTALRAGDLSATHVDQILERLQTIAAERAAADSATIAAGASTLLTRRQAIDGPTVARLVARAKRQSVEAVAERRPRWLSPLREQVQRAGRALQRAHERVADLGVVEAEQLLHEVIQLERDIQKLVTLLHEQQRAQTDGTTQPEEDG